MLVSGCKFLTEEDVLGQVVNKLSPEDVIMQLSVQLLLLLPIEQLSVGPGRIISRHLKKQFH